MAAIAEPERLARPALPATQEERERREYRQTLAWVLGVHLFALLLFFIAGAFRSVKKPEQVAWLLGGELGGGGAVESVQSPPAEEASEPERVVHEPEPEPERAPAPPLPPPPAPSELVIPQATPVPTTPKPATPKPSTPKPATPSPSTPKPTTPKPTTPKPATPKTGTPQPATPKAAAKGTSEKPASAKTEASAASAKSTGPTASSTPGRNSKPGGATSGSGKGTGKAGSGPGSGAASDFGGYFSLLRDRYYAVWNQPTSLDRSSGDLITTLRIKAKRDGTVLGYEIVKGSGNSVMDGSVLAAAEQVTKIDPIPQGLGREDILEIPINFKLDQGQ